MEFRIPAFLSIIADQHVFHPCGWKMNNRFDLDLNDKVIKFPINYNDSILEYAYKILQDNNFVDAKIIDLRIDNKIINRFNSFS